MTLIALRIPRGLLCREWIAEGEVKEGDLIGGCSRWLWARMAAVMERERWMERKPRYGVAGAGLDGGRLGEKQTGCTGAPRSQGDWQGLGEGVSLMF